MIIQFASDLHLEFSQNKEFLRTNLLKPCGDILLLAGDIVPFTVMHKHEDFFSYISDNFQTTYWIPGNHEYYNFDAAKKCGKLNEKIRNNVNLVNNTSVIQDNIKLIFSTLWTCITPANQWNIQQNLSDFHVIKYEGKPFNVNQYNQLYMDSINFLQQELQSQHIDEIPANQYKMLIVSHHVPTFYNYPEKYKGDMLNEAFAVENFDFIEASNIDYWIFGHHHTNIPEFIIGKTKMLTNQLGYVKYDEHKEFISNKIIVVE